MVVCRSPKPLTEVRILVGPPKSASTECVENMSYQDKNIQSYNKGAQEWAMRVPTNAGHMYLEKPSIEKELPTDLVGKVVLCIGVGSGYELDEILKRNPSNVVGIDTSDALIKIASEKYPSVKFFVMDMMHMNFPNESFDFVYSSLTFHYSNDWDALLAGVRRVLHQKGTLLFSTHNPKYWSNNPKTGNEYTNERGIKLTEHTATLPAGNIDITYYNHSSEQSIRSSIEHAGFRIESFFAPLVVELTKEQLAGMDEKEQGGYMRLKDKNLVSPLFLVVRATLI